MKKIQIKFYPNKGRQSKKTGKTPVYMRITKDGRKAESKLLFELDQDQLSLWNVELERLNVKGAILNMHIEKIETRFNQLVAIDFERIYTLSVKELRDELLGKNNSDSKFFREFLREYIKVEVHDSPLLKPATKLNYDKAAKHMYNFLETKPKILVNQIDFRFANDFKNYLMNKKPDGRKGMTEVSACGIIKKFRKIMNHAVHLEYHSTNPFKQVKLSYDSPEKENFPISELPKLFRLDKLNHIEQKHLLIFQFMVLTGAAYKDCQDLTKENLQQKKGDLRLTYRRNKTQHISDQFLTKQALSTLQKLQDNYNSDLVPDTPNQYFNRVLKLIQLKNGISHDLNTHLARGIYRQLLNEARINMPLTIDRLMGWSSKGKIDNKYMKVTITDLNEAKNKLQVLLNSILN